MTKQTYAFQTTQLRSGVPPFIVKPRVGRSGTADDGASWHKTVGDCQDLRVVESVQFTEAEVSPGAPKYEWPLSGVITVAVMTLLFVFRLPTQQKVVRCGQLTNVGAFCMCCILVSYLHRLPFYPGG